MEIRLVTAKTFNILFRKHSYQILFLTKKKTVLETTDNFVFREFVRGPISSSPLNCLLFCQEQNSLIYFKYCINLVYFPVN